MIVQTVLFEALCTAKEAFIGVGVCTKATEFSNVIFATASGKLRVETRNGVQLRVFVDYRWQVIFIVDSKATALMPETIKKHTLQSVF